MRLSLQTFCVLLSATFLAQAVRGESEPTFHLKKGVYVAGKDSCRTAANAGILEWDGKGLSGAHSAKCFTMTTGQVHNPYTIVTRCSALGDGTAATPDEQTASLTVRSSHSFRLEAQDASGKVISDQEYHWSCRVLR